MSHLKVAVLKTISSAGREVEKSISLFLILDVLKDSFFRSKPCGTCNPILCGLNLSDHSLKASFALNFERFIVGGFLIFPELASSGSPPA